jgi:replication factor C large subunit
MMWTEKHKPKTVGELVISEDTKKRFLKFVTQYDKERKKALLLWGAPGIGKTLLPHVFAKQNSYEIIELNASLKRSKKIIEEQLKNIVTTASIFGSKKIILIDEVDCLGRTDRGGLSAIINAVKITKHPIVLTAEDYWDQKISQLRKHVLGLEVKAAGKEKKMEYLKKVLEQERTFYQEDAIKKMVEGADFRAAINDAQVLHNAGGVTVKNLETLGYRNKRQQLKTSIHETLTAQNFAKAFKSINACDGDVREITTWISENLAHYGAQSEHYNKLAVSDVFAGRVLKRQYWRLMYYQRVLLAGLNSLQGEGVKYPEIIKKMFITRSKRAKRNSISDKLKKTLHTSKHKINEYYLPWLKALSKKELEALELDKEEINYLLSNH